jgi:putative membrane protein
MNPTFARISRNGVAVLAASVCSALMAQVTPTPTMTPDQPMSDSVKEGSITHHDHAFLKKAAKAGMKEVAVSQAVMDHLTNPQVRAFARQMVGDHTANNSELMTLASSKGVQIAAEDPSIGDDWAKKTGDVDKMYVDEMVSDHEAAVKLFEKASEKSSDADIQAFAQKTLPTLQHHLMMAQDLKKTVD